MIPRFRLRFWGYVRCRLFCSMFIHPSALALLFKHSHKKTESPVVDEVVM